MLEWLRKRRERFYEYLYDSAFSVRDQAFILFSVAVLIALFVAIPCGLIMREPPIATLSTAVGTLFFTVYVCYSIKNRRIERAKKVISFILVFAFLPGMFFTNGGAEGGTPVWLLLGTIYISMILEGRFKMVMLLLNAVVTIGCWIIGYLFPSLVASYSRGGNYFDSVAALLIVSFIVYVLIAFRGNLLKKEEEYKSSKRLFEQTAVALVNAIDAKDKYTHGHSSRVAEYARKLAEMNFKSEKECEEIYYAALLHDVGKIGISESIITKEGKLTKEEYEDIKKHPMLGSQILQSITEFPYLSIGTLGHHERYDGKGYPYGLKGDDVPEIARIISIADAYDAMTSKRSYRDPIPQQIVREEIIKGIGTQFDPDYARLMLHLIDVDTEYEMREREEASELSGRDELVIAECRSEVSEGIWITDAMTTIRLTVNPIGKGMGSAAAPSLLLFDSLDGRFHDGDKEIRDLNYLEYGEIFFDGRTSAGEARKMQTKGTDPDGKGGGKCGTYKIDAVRIRDHALIRITGEKNAFETIVALSDSTRYLYVGLTGAYCRLHDISVEKAETACAEDFIPRIAGEISYIDGPAGDIPNVQIDGFRTASSEGVELTDGLQISFRAKSLPTARLVWHCPYIDIFCADDGKVNGKNYRDLAFVRFDGEGWECDPASSLKQSTVTGEDFAGWDVWKSYNRDGFETTVTFAVEENRVTIITENAGIAIKDTVVLTGIDRKLYAAVTGDQVAIMNIRIAHGTGSRS